MDHQVRKILHIVAVLLFGVNLAQSQDPVVSQHYAAAPYLNPATPSESVNANFSAVIRTFTNAHYKHYSFYSAAFVQPFKVNLTNEFEKYNHQSAIDVLVYHEETGGAGRLAKSNVIAGFAHKVQLANTHFLNAGFQAGISLLQANSNFQWGSEYSEVEGYVDGSSDVVPDYDGAKMYPLLNAGLLWTYVNSDKEIYMRKYPFDCFLGFAMSNINKPNYSLFDDNEVNLPVLMKIHGGIQWYASNFVSLYPNFIYSSQNNKHYFDIGAYAYFGYRKTEKNLPLNFVIGVWYKRPDVATTLFGFVLDHLQIGISYDISFDSSLAIGNRGPSSAELTAKYLFKRDKHEYRRGYSYPVF